MCLAHLLPDAQWATGYGDSGFSVPFKLWLLHAMAIGRRRDALRNCTLERYRCDLERRLDRIMAHATPRAQKCCTLRRRIGRCRVHPMEFAPPPRGNRARRRSGRFTRRISPAYRGEWLSLRSCENNIFAR